MEEMEYLSLRKYHLSVIKLKSFDFPQLLSYRDANRYDDDGPTFSVWFHVPGERASVYLYSSFNQAEWEAVRAEVRTWNADPEKYWKEALRQAYQSEIESGQRSIELHKQDIKKSRKALKKLDR